jgi:hypothetical protein
MFADDFLPTYDVSDAIAVVVEADAASTWQALMQVDLLDVARRRPVVGLLRAARMLPDIAARLLHGERPPAAPGHMRLRDTATMYELSAGDLGDGRTLLSRLMRTAATDATARRWFRRYCTLGVASGAHVLVNGVLEQARAGAEGSGGRVTEHRSPGSVARR